MRLPDPAGSYALLIGTSRYTDPDLQDLPSVERNLAAMRSVLTRPDIGGLKPEHCLTVKNPKTPADITGPLLSVAEQVEDCLVLYFAGHGLVSDRDDDLYLSMTGTSRRDMWSSALRYGDVRQILGDRLPDRKVVVILDCCYAGRAIPRMSSSEVPFNDEIRGAYVLAATARDATALAPADAELTAFTGTFVEILSCGIAGQPDLLSLDAVYEQLRLRLRRNSHPLPRRNNMLTGPLALARNVHRPEPTPAVAGRQRTPDGSAVLGFLEELPLVRRGYRMGSVVAGIGSLLQRMADPQQCVGLRPPFFPRCRRRTTGFPTERVDEFILSHRPAPASFPDALRRILANWGLLLTPEDATSRRVTRARAAALAPAQEQVLAVARLRPWGGCWLMITDWAVRLGVDDRWIKVSFDDLGELLLSRKTKEESWAMGDTGGVNTLSSLVVDYRGVHAETWFYHTDFDSYCIRLVDAIREAWAAFPTADR